MSYLVGAVQGKQGGKYDLEYDKGVSYIIDQVTNSTMSTTCCTWWGHVKTSHEPSMIYAVTQVCHRQSCIVQHRPSHKSHHMNHMSYLVGALQGKQGVKYDLEYEKGVSYIIDQVTNSTL